MPPEHMNAAGLAGMNRVGKTDWPFIVIRHDMGVNDAPDVFAALMECHARHPGACDEFWFATGSRKTIHALTGCLEL